MAVSILSSIIVWVIAAIVVLRTLHFSGIRINGGKTYKFLTASLTKKANSDTSYKAYQVFCAALLFRLIIYVFEILILFMFTDTQFTVSTFLRRLEIWDSTNYVRIASVGYQGYMENGAYTTLVFFPLYPYAAKIVNFIVHNMHVSLLLTSTLAYAGGCTFLYKTCLIDYGHETAKKAVIYASIFPFAFFFGTMMSESMLFFTTAMTLYFIRSHKWLFAGIAGLLASLSRLVGVLIVVAAAVEFLEEYKIFELLKNKQFKTVWQHIYSKGLYLLLIPLGTCLYLIINKLVSGDAFAFLHYDEQFWGQGSQYFGKCISMVAANAVNISDRHRMLTMWLPYLTIIVLCAVMLIYGLRRNRNMYCAYFLAYFILNTSIKYPISGCRYMTCAIPLFIVMSDLSSRHKKADKWITVIFSVLFGIYLVAYLHDMII